MKPAPLLRVSDDAVRGPHVEARSRARVHLRDGEPPTSGSPTDPHGGPSPGKE